MYTIHLVEDEENLNKLLTIYLEKEGYTVVSFADGQSAMQRIANPPDLWILDVMLPDIDGYQLIKAIKEHNDQTPVIFMSARNQELDRVVGLELGSDDYLSKPFLPRELIIRTNKLLQRIYGNKEEYAAVTQLESYIVDRKQRAVFDGAERIILTNKEFGLLLYFIENRNSVVSREQILEKVWGDNYFGSDRVVDDTIRRLRKKLSRVHIETIYGFGYKLEVL
ncbi:two-component system response regulator CssR [Paenibacillus cellulosilyticus]|uniref:Two-component system response regulator CssR n=1 Tax=Paenibacillus cellulosilyticus TaxID=375489 RepID=A0A2V2YZC6_9BACL|nr:response regulator transcription factor [Paenibacillus cellulosilyticus]PWW07272.1 two-component system response regulator CssR [Paenibacillus cellulosilyticus]QKS44538.1 response regulator transcription factor [Paenibacillus cellulosilyticus]